jgi:hypothetical protein
MVCVGARDNASLQISEPLMIERLRITLGLKGYTPIALKELNARISTLIARGNGVESSTVVGPTLSRQRPAQAG